MGKVTITLKQVRQFNDMITALKRIRSYQAPQKLYKQEIGLDEIEALEMAYDNMRSEADLVKNIKPIILNPYGQEKQSSSV